MLGKSFKLYILFHLFIGLAVIVLANRQIAQYYLGQQLTDRVRLELAQGLAYCGQSLPDQDSYLKCFALIETDSLTAVVAHEHVYCPPLASHLPQPAPCQSLRAQDRVWLPSAAAGLPIESAQATLEQQLWFAARHASQPQGQMLLVGHSHSQNIQEQVWALRDRNLIFVLPFIFSALLLVALYVAFVALQPLRQLEKYMLVLDSSNLQGTGQPQPQFLEFRRFLLIFQDLRLRLDDSLGRARRFAGDASHELRTPLTILRGHCEQLIRRLPLGSDTQVQARVIGDEVERLITIVEKLLLLSRADANSLKPHMQALNLSETLEQMMGDSDLASSALELRTQIAPGIVWHCDRALVMQMLNNLYTNAILYNVAGGWVSVWLTRQADGFVLTFENPTALLSDELLAHAFERFYRASHDRNIDGHGLGLSLCLEIAKVHAASLSLERRPGQIFRISLRAPLPANAGDVNRLHIQTDFPL